MNKIPKVIFFDVNETLLDLTPVKDSVAKALGGKKELVPLWFTTLLHYSLVTTVSSRFTDFGSIGAAALQMIADQQGLPLSEQDAQEALKPIRSLPPHSEVPEALKKLQEAGFRLFALTNSASEALNDQMTNSGLKSYFEDLLSVETVRLYKPHRDVYAWATEKVSMRPEDCLLVAAHGWDVAGARWAGWQTAFIARPGQMLYPLAEAPDWNVPDLAQLTEQLLTYKEDA